MSKVHLKWPKWKCQPEIIKGQSISLLSSFSSQPSELPGYILCSYFLWIETPLSRGFGELRKPTRLKMLRKWLDSKMPSQRYIGNKHFLERGDLLVDLTVCCVGSSRDVDLGSHHPCNWHELFQWCSYLWVARTPNGNPSIILLKIPQ